MPLQNWILIINSENYLNSLFLLRLSFVLVTSASPYLFYFLFSLGISLSLPAVVLFRDALLILPAETTGPSFPLPTISLNNNLNNISNPHIIH